MLSCASCGKQADKFVRVKEFLGVSQDYGNQYHEYWECIECFLEGLHSGSAPVLHTGGEGSIPSPSTKGRKR